MALSCTPLLRFALHLLLAGAVLLQASLALAMRPHLGDNPPAAAGMNAQPDETAMGSSHRLPPCHALATADRPTGEAPATCCDDGSLGESCRWACAQALSLPPPLTIRTDLRASSDGFVAPSVPAPDWIPRSPLRPPIG